jgi:hypothetical protein
MFSKFYINRQLYESVKVAILLALLKGTETLKTERYAKDIYEI